VLSQRTLYRGTILEIGVPPVSFAVTDGPTAQDTNLLEALGLPSAFAVITPCNPHGRDVAAATNDALLASARDELLAAGYAGVRGDGRSTDGAHRENGFAIAMPRDAANALAMRWNQQAFWWIDGRLVWVCGAHDRLADERVTR
jgi:hypothetical protein